jgi:PAS domain S-box-containing protein
MSVRAANWRRVLVVIAGLLVTAMAGLSVYGRAVETVPEDGLRWIDRAGSPVAEVEPGGPAAEAGLRNGDRLLSVGEAAVEDDLVAEDLMATAVPGEDLRLRVVRGQEIWERTLVPEGRSALRPSHAYIALVGALFLAAGLWAGVRRPYGPGLVPYVLLCGALGLLFMVSWTHRAAPLDHFFYWTDQTLRLALPFLFLLFALSFSGLRRPGRGWMGLAALPGALLLLVQIQLVARGGIYRFGDAEIRVLELLRRAELGLLALYLAAGVAVLSVSYLKHHSEARRVQLLWIFWGSLLGFGPFVTFYLAPHALGVSTPLILELAGMLTLTLVPLAYTAALLEYRLMDLQLFLRRGLILATTLTFLVAVYLGFWKLFGALLPLLFERVGYIPGLMAGLCTGLLVPVIRAASSNLVGRIFYRERYNFRLTLVAFGRELNAELDLDRLVERLRTRLREGLDLESVSVFLRNESDGSFVFWDAERRGRALPASGQLDDRLRDVSYVTVSELEAARCQAASSLGETGLRYVVPMRLEGEQIAALAVGGPRSGQPLDSEDLELIVALSSHAAAAIASAHLIRQVRSKVMEVERLRARTDNIVQSSQIGILVVDEEGVVRLWNPALERIYGLRSDEALGRPFGELFPLHLVHRLRRAFRGEVEEGSDPGRLYRVRLDGQRGEPRWVNLALSELPDEQGGTARMITFDDVTSQVSMEEQLLRNERLASIGLLAAGVAHEVNTPLTGISSYAQLLLEEAPGDDPRRPLLEKIVGQSRRASSIANSLLNFSRTSGPDSALTEPVDLAELVNESVALLRPQLRRSRVQVHTDLDPALPPVYGDRGKLQQVLLNLLLNARDAVPENGNIDVSLKREAHALRVEVRDDGIGISEQDRAKIFDPFFTTKRRGEGTGLGLSLSHNIVREHGGEIHVTSVPGEGATFSVALPLRVPATDGAGSHRDGPPDTPVEA